jgi:hypothetical protein
MLAKRATLDWLLLFLISALGLFLELAVIRWIAGEVRLFAYFKNLLLLAAFLGLSIGFAVVGKGRDYLPSFASLLAILVVLVLLVGRTTSSRGLPYAGGNEEMLWRPAILPDWLSSILFLSIVLVFFLLTTFIFIPLGQATGEEMSHHAPVPAYIVNLLASLVGTWLFSWLSYLQTPPELWFAVGLVGVTLYLLARRTLSRSAVALFAVSIVALLVAGRGEIWSPYQRLTVTELTANRASDGQRVRVGYILNVQQVFYQVTYNLSPEFVAQVPELKDAAFLYSLPYKLRPGGQNVLILGAGTGNDVAAALRHNAARVSAVEIDPAILALGRKLHPEQPYADSRVLVIVDDARSFLKRDTGRYDVVSFGLLDSHTLLSSFSSVRLDSFVYTLESFRQAKAHLADGGVVAMAFATEMPWIEERLGRMLVEVFGADQVFVHYGELGPIFVAGPVPPGKLAELELAAWQPDPTIENLPMATDDWPYLYMRARKVPSAYWQALLFIGLIGLALAARYFPEALRPNGHFWLLGAAFLLIEFKSITELALLFGSTWLVNALAISGVLLMALAANLLVLWRPHVNLRLAYVLLFASLGLAYFVPLEWLAGFAPFMRALLSVALLSLPLFFAGLIFSESLRRAGETAKPLASNLSGSVAGGMLEYGSIGWGIKSLYVIAFVTYAGALLAFLLQRKRG